MDEHAVTVVHRPAKAYLPLVFGALGGVIASVLALVALVVLVGYQGGEAPVALNAVGAWFVRWLQTADRTALDGYYWDATVGGAVAFIAVGVLVGAVFAGFLDRLPEDHPIAWGALLGLTLWALTIWAIAPALDPVLTRAVPHYALLGSDLVFGIALGAWVHSGRAVRQLDGRV